MNPLDSLRSCFGITTGPKTGLEEDASQPRPAGGSGSTTPSTTLADRASIAPPGARRAGPSTGLLATIRSWASALCCGVTRSKHSSSASLYEALKMAKERPEALSELEDRPIRGDYFLDAFHPDEPSDAKTHKKGPIRREEDAKYFEVLKKHGLSLGQVALKGQIILEDNSWNGSQQVSFVNQLAGSRDEPCDGRPANATGVTVATGAKGISVEDAVKLQLLETALSSKVTVGHIKLTGQVTKPECLGRVAEILRMVKKARGTTDLRGVTFAMPLTVARTNTRQAHADGPSRDSPAEQTPVRSEDPNAALLSNLQLLKAHGVRKGLHIQGDLDLDTQNPAAQLRSWLSLAEPSYIPCTGPRRIFEDLTLHVKLPELLVSPTSTRPYDATKVARLLERAAKAGAKICFEGTVPYGKGKLDALERMTRIPGLPGMFSTHITPDTGGPMDMDRADVRKLRKLASRGVVIDKSLREKAVRVDNSKVLKII